MALQDNRGKLSAWLRANAGNTLIMGIMVLSLLSGFGVVMTSRMIIDSDISARQVVATKAFYLADAGIQWGRRRLVFSTNPTTLGPTTIGDGSVTVRVRNSQIDYPSSGNRINVYEIKSTATVGPTTREIVEYRRRGGGADKQFVLWRENIADELD